MNWIHLILPTLSALPLSVTLLNLVTWSRPTPQTAQPGGSLRSTRADRHQSATPTASVLIPARNEERNIGTLLSSLALELQDSPQIQVIEVLVYDDQSTDGTARIVEQHAATNPAIRLIAGVPLAEGWVGKAHACHHLLTSARGDLVFFVDADVVLQPFALAALAQQLTSSPGCDLVTAVPRQETGSWFERLVIPLLHVTYTSWLPLLLIAHCSGPRFAAANGQLVAANRSALVQAGGFKLVRNAVVDDVALVKALKSLGHRVDFVDGFAVGQCRMYRSRGEVIQGFTKNIFEGIGSVPGLVLALSLYFSCFVLPYLVLVVGACGLISPGWVHGALVAVAFNVLLRTLLAVRFRQPLTGILLHPVGVLLLLHIAWRSLRAALKGELSWAGRVYPSTVWPSPASSQSAKEHRSP